MGKDNCIMHVTDLKGNEIVLIYNLKLCLSKFA